MRADARRNRERILAAADVIYGGGRDTASTEEVAERAGVGIGTVFRHFPTKADLLAAVLTKQLQRLRANAAAIASGAEPAAAFFAFFEHVVESTPGKIAVGNALEAEGGDVPAEVTKAAGEFWAAVAELLRKAQDAGAVRADIDPPALRALLVGTCHAAVLTGVDEHVTGRMLAIVFDGLRTVR